MVTYLTELADPHGVLLRSEALAQGIDDNALRRAVDGGELIRMRWGAYAVAEVFLRGTFRDRHLLLCRAVLRQYGDHVALSHGSACVWMGGPDYGLQLDQVDLTHLSGGGRRQSRVVHHRGELRVGDLRRADGVWMTTPARAAIEVAAFTSLEAGLVQADHFLHAGLTTPHELRSTAEAMACWPGAIRRHPLLLVADAGHESVGESRTGLLMFRQGLPRPELQIEVRRPDGSLVGRLDGGWPSRGVAFEFDGLAKYRRHRRPGESIEDAVLREKLREDEIRGLTGWIIIRLTWADLAKPEATSRMIRRAFETAARRPALVPSSVASSW